MPLTIIECLECPHEFDQHADLAGCWGDNGKCPCTESKATLSDDENEEN